LNYNKQKKKPEAGPPPLSVKAVGMAEAGQIFELPCSIVCILNTVRWTIFKSWVTQNVLFHCHNA